ncbi:MAG TPA: hypothetical protein H9870_13840 [Candidatus Corynebacterium avicola]|uniref:ABC3 transporter permease C-terminal domain-containing protein n=1 Tax=Candidatus Corynebacterium avicola TaxID=2838527 RepID=A0A9D1UNA4_9CORY|nr:hypothetical protein [Candidatus Corynebacterium avicola]
MSDTPSTPSPQKPNRLTAGLRRTGVALRLARRDLLRHKIRTLVGVLLFALPVALVVGFFSMIESYYKGATAPLDTAGYVEFQPHYEPGSPDGPTDAAEWKESTGVTLHEVLGDQADSLSPSIIQEADASQGDRNGEITVRSIEAPADGGDPMVPRGEIQLAGQDAYLLDVSTGDTVTVDGTELTASVTRAWNQSAVNAADITSDSDDVTASITWHYPADATVGTDFNESLSQSESELSTDDYGAWLRAPESSSDRLIDLESWSQSYAGSSGYIDAALVVISVTVLMVLLISAVISPVFAVAARRLRHAMGLLSAGGAAPSDLRRIMLAQGVLVSFVGAALGLLGSVGIGAGLSSFQSSGEFTWAWDVAIPVTVVAVICGITSALIPARRAGREDPVQALADGGSERMTGFRKRMLVGIPFLILGVILCAADPDLLVPGVTLLGIGVILSGSLLVWAMSQSGGRLSTAARLAFRDGHRNHHRTIPAIAAISGVTFLAALMISVPFDDPEPNAFEKDVAIVSGSVGGDETIYAREIDTAADKLDATDRTAVSSASGAERGGEELKASVKQPDGYRDPEVYPHRVPEGAPYGPYVRGMSLQQDVAVHDGSAFAAFKDIPTRDVTRAEQALAEGKAVVGDPDLVTDGQVSIDLLGESSVEDSVYESADVEESMKVPAVVIESTSGALGAPLVSISQATAESLDLDVEYISTMLTLEHDVSTLRAILVSSGAWPVKNDFVNVETPGVDGVRAGFAITPVVLSWILTLGTVLLVVLLAATESRRDMATITAMGAPPGMLRRYSATQAVSVATVGTVAGVVTGLLPAAKLWLNGELPGFLSGQQWTGVGLTVVIGPVLAWLAGQAIGAWTSRDDQVARRRD